MTPGLVVALCCYSVYFLAVFLATFLTGFLAAFFVAFLATFFLEAFFVAFLATFFLEAFFALDRFEGFVGDGSGSWVVMPVGHTIENIHHEFHSLRNVEGVVAHSPRE